VRQTLRDVQAVTTFIWNHPANRERRLRSLLRSVRFQLKGRMGRRTITPIGIHGRMYADLHWTGASKVVYANPPDWAEMQAWRRILKPGDIFLDVGSNVGSYALWAADLGAEVIAVEPDANAVARLRENIGLSQFDVEVLQCALGRKLGSSFLTTGLDTVNHLVMNPTPDSQMIAVRTVDDVLGERYAAGVKIDVEGAERLVLEGATKALEQHRIGYLQLEWNEMSRCVLNEDRKPVHGLLRSFGYRLYRPDSEGALRPVGNTDYGSDVFAVSPVHLP